MPRRLCSDEHTCPNTTINLFTLPNRKKLNVHIPMTIAADLAINELPVKATIPVFWCSLHNHIQELSLARQAIDEIRVVHPDSTPSNVKAIYMSPWKSHLLNEKLHPLVNLVTEVAEKTSELYLKANLKALNFVMKVTDCWGVLYESADYTMPHTHYPADLSAVIYLEAGENSAPIVFGDGISVQPKPGLLVLFPGVLLHSVPANNDKRVVIAMNLNKFPSFA
jgi:hypothetical protein